MRRLVESTPYFLFKNMNITALKIESSNKSITVTRSDISSCTSNDLSDILNYLLLGDNVVFLAWDLDEVVSHLIKRLSKDKCIELQKTAKTTYKDYRIFYIAGKLFSLTFADSYKPRNIYHLEQYFPNYEAPKNLQETLDMGNQLMQALKIMNMNSYKLSSPVAIYEDCVLNNMVLPTFKSSNIPKDAARYSWKCSGKLWIEAYKVGHFDNAVDYDISSAFPTFAKQMVDTTGSKWIHDDKFHKDATYGFCKGIVTIFKHVSVSPIIYENEAGELSSPTGTWNTYLTKQEIEFIYEWKIGTFEIEDGYWCYCVNENKHPLENVCNRLLAFKKHKNKIVKLLAKRMSVGGLYGKFGEEHKERFGKHVNFPWFSCISVLARLEVARFIYQNHASSHLIHVSVDGILLDCSIEECNKEWELKND